MRTHPVLQLPAGDLLWWLLNWLRDYESRPHRPLVDINTNHMWHTSLFAMTEPLPSPETCASPAPEPDLDSLVAQILDGEESAWPQFLLACRIKLLPRLQFIDRDLAEDALQEMHLKIVHDPTCLCDVGSTEAWLFTVSSRVLFRLMRQRRRAQLPDETQPGEPLDPNPTVLEELTTSESAARVRRAIESLDEDWRLLIREHYITGKTFEQLAVELGVPSATLRTWHRRAKEHIARELSGESNDR